MSTLLKFSGLALIYVANAKDFVTFDELDGIAASPQKMFNDQDSKLHKFELKSAKQGWEGFIKKLKHPGPLLSVCSGKTGPELNQCYDQNGLRGDKVIALRSKIENLKSEQIHGVDAIKYGEEMMARLHGEVAEMRNHMRTAFSASTCCRDASEMNGDNANYCMPTWDNIHQAGFRCVYRCHTGPGVMGIDIMPGVKIPGTGEGGAWGKTQDKSVETIMHPDFANDYDAYFGAGTADSAASQLYYTQAYSRPHMQALDAGAALVNNGGHDPSTKYTYDTESHWYMNDEASGADRPEGIYTTGGLDSSSKLDGHHVGVAANIDNGRDQLCLYREGTDTGKDVSMVWQRQPAKAASGPITP